MQIPKEAQELYNEAEDHIDNMEYEKALDYLDKVLEITPNYAEALSTLGFVHVVLAFKKMSKEKACEILRKALNLNSNSPKTWKNMGIYYYVEKEHDKAIECSEKAIEIDPNYEAAWNLIGLTYKDKKEYDKAIECYEKAVEIDANYIYAWGNMGVAYESKKEYNKAIECYEKVIGIDPNHIDALRYLCKVYGTIGNTKKMLFYAKKLSARDKHMLSEIPNLEEKLNTIENRYQGFRNLQSKIKSIAIENPNIEYVEKLSNIDLSNILEIHEDLKEYQETEGFISVLKPFTPNKNVLNDIIPLDIENSIRKTILKLGVKYPRLLIAEIAEKCDEPEDCVIVVLREMIKNKEIYAEFFESTKSLVFDQQTNINEVDDLMKKFDEWEKESRDKKQ